MKMYILLAVAIVLLVIGLSAWNIYSGVTLYKPAKGDSVFYTLSCKMLGGEDFQFEQLKGKRVLIVNTASECGFTTQYQGLQKLHESYGGDDFVILGLPCNDFGNQESGSAEEISGFCSSKFGVEFQMMEKVKVKGDEVHPVYVWLKSKEKNGVGNHSIRWNFHKFLIDAEGNLVASLRSGVKPSDEVITSFASGESSAK